MGRFKEGFVLLEVLLATAIAAFAICGILLMYIVGMDLIRSSKNTSIATNAAQGLIEEIRFTSPLPDVVTKYKGLKFSVNGIPSSSGVVYVDDTNSDFLLVTISVCWRQGNKIIGEDKNLNGELDAGEDTNDNLMIDSPAELVTQVTSR
ncbi:MAG: hypothetical protein NT014_05540 [Candidatus Omnitrophica bacterium]|nr:hypothetical protein [Candidatus Omnitrophota bacterium]